MFEGNRVVAHTRSRYPVFQSPMTWIARAPLVSAVSAAGGMGLLENSIADLSVTTREFAAIRAATNQPFERLDWSLGGNFYFSIVRSLNPKIANLRRAPKIV